MRILREARPTTVTVSVAVSTLLSLFVTVKVYVVVISGVTDSGMSEVTSPIPLSILPAVPLIKTAVRSTLLPVVMVVDEALKLVMAEVGDELPPLSHALIKININSDIIILIANFMG